MLFRSFCFAFITLFSVSAHSQNLVINEVSQGTGNAEYVEFVVTGNPTCQTPVPTVDLRGVILDDNNGYFNPATGSGIATGAIRFANTAFWSAIPQGTIIVVYNDGDANSALPADDVSMNDGNCSLIIPVSSNLIEGQGTGPTNGTPTYPANPTWVAGGGNWSQIGMANGSDSFQVRQNITSAAPIHGVSWGNNTNNTIIYFAGSAASKVFSLMNSIDINPSSQANWVSGDVGVNETPGQPNSPQNQAWIASMNPTCYGVPGINLSFNVTPTDCGAACNGSATVNINGGASPYSYSWSSGQNTATISNQCTGTYTITVTDNLGCSATSDTVIPQNSPVQAGAIYANESCEGECNGNIIANGSGGTGPYAFSWSNGAIGNTNSGLCPGDYQLTVIDQNGCIDNLTITIEAGTVVTDPMFNNPDTILITDGIVLIPTMGGNGTWTSECGNCISNAGVFDPTVSGVGTFEVCYTTSNGNCSETHCDSITVIPPCTDTNTLHLK